MRLKLQNSSFPRAQMSLIVLLTGGCGLLASFAMLQFGVFSMTLRYPIALGFAYLFFLFLIWLWLRTNASDYFDAADIPDALPSGGGSAGVEIAWPSVRAGGGGDFVGAGASGDFGPLASMPLRRVASAATADSPFGAVGDAVGSVTDSDELAIPILAIVLAVGLALASLYVIYIAPVLFAEVLVDSSLSYALFRRLRARDPMSWLSSTFRRTALPFVITAVFLGAMGAAMSAYVPGAHSVGQFVKQARKGHGL